MPLNIISFLSVIFAALSVTPEKAAEMKVNKVTMEEILKNLNGFEPEAAVRTKLLKMDVLNGLTVLEGYMVSTMRELMENRLRELGTKQKNEQETYEEQQLTKYLGLISDSRGMLKVPKKVNADENGLEILAPGDRAGWSMCAIPLPVLCQSVRGRIVTEPLSSIL